jgi:multiple sugar transport system permease protein
MRRGLMGGSRTLVLMCIPCFLVLAVIVIVPILNLIKYSLYNYELSNPLGIKFIGLLNYAKAFIDREFLKSIWVTVLYIIGALAIEVPVSLLLIEALYYIKKGNGLIKALIMPPMVVPPIIAGVMWRIMYHPTAGLVNYFLENIGLTHHWLSDPKTALVSLILVDFWQNTPFLILILLAGRSAIPSDFYEAGMIDGAGAFRLFRHITLPLLRPSLILGVLFRVIESLKVFPTIHIMTAGGPGGNATTTINYYTYKMAFSYTNIGYSSALGFILLFMTTLLSIVLLHTFRNKENAAE